MKFQELKTEQCTVELHENYHGACFNCCDYCNYDDHRCHFCGQELYHDSYEDKDGKIRHYLSDCRPDLIPESKDGPMV